MSNKRELAKDVLKAIDQASGMVGKFRDRSFNSNVWHECVEIGMRSPLEQILYVAFEAVREINYSDPAEPEKINGKDYLIGLGLIPQYGVGKYRADFLGVFGCKYGNGTVRRNEVIVECDSQQFHERTERERRYEKERDRFFQVSGYKVFRYTGKEIMEDPLKVACGVIGYLTEQDADDLYRCCEEFK